MHWELRSGPGGLGEDNVMEVARATRSKAGLSTVCRVRDLRVRGLRAHYPRVAPGCQQSCTQELLAALHLLDRHRG